jgi:hypothetical protein
MPTHWTKTVAVLGWVWWLSGCGAGPSGGMDATSDIAAMDGSPSSDTSGEDAVLDSRESPVDSSSNVDVTSTDVATLDAAESDPPTGDFIAFDLAGARRVYSSFGPGSKLVVGSYLSAAPTSAAGQIGI